MQGLVNVAWMAPANGSCACGERNALRPVHRTCRRKAPELALPNTSADVISASAAMAKKSLSRCGLPGAKADAFRRAAIIYAAFLMERGPRKTGVLHLRPVPAIAAQCAADALRDDPPSRPISHALANTSAPLAANVAGHQAPPRQSAAAQTGSAWFSAVPCKAGFHRSESLHVPERRSRSPRYLRERRLRARRHRVSRRYHPA